MQKRGRASGNEVLKRLEIVLCFPKVAKYYFLINGGFLLANTLNNALDVLEKKELPFEE